VFVAAHLRLENMREARYLHATIRRGMKMRERHPPFVVDLTDAASLQSWAEILELPAAILTEAATQARSGCRTALTPERVFHLSRRMAERTILKP
jgi:hypothetical protein